MLQIEIDPDGTQSETLLDRRRGAADRRRKNILATEKATSDGDRRTA